MNNYPYYNQYYALPVQPQMQRIQPIQPIEQPYQQYMQNQQVYKQQMNLQGKSVDSIEVVKAMDIPLDGTVSYFPLTDGSAIVTKQLQQDGSSKTVIYKPASLEEVDDVPKYVTIEELKESIKKINNDALKEEIKAIKKQIKDMSQDINDLRKVDKK